MVFAYKLNHDYNKKMHDLLKRELMTLLDEIVEQGEHDIHFNASGLPLRMYFYTINVDCKMMQRSTVIQR